MRGDGLLWAVLARVLAFVYRGAVALEINCGQIGAGMSSYHGLRDDHHRPFDRRGLPVRAAGDRRLRRPRRLAGDRRPRAHRRGRDRDRADHDRRRRGDRRGRGGRQGCRAGDGASAGVPAQADRARRGPLRRGAARAAEAQRPRRPLQRCSEHFGRGFASIRRSALARTRIALGARKRATANASRALHAQRGGIRPARRWARPAASGERPVRRVRSATKSSSLRRDARGADVHDGVHVDGQRRSERRSPTTTRCAGARAQRLGDAAPVVALVAGYQVDGERSPASESDAQAQRRAAAPARPARRAPRPRPRAPRTAPTRRSRCARRTRPPRASPPAAAAARARSRRRSPCRGRRQLVVARRGAAAARRRRPRAARRARP